MIDTVRNALRSVAIDSEDSFNVLDLTLAGIDNVCQTEATSLAGAARMPKMLLFGESPSGLGNTGEGDKAVYQSRLSQIRNDVASPALERIVELITSQKTANWGEDWKVEFQPLWQPSEKEKAETAKADQEAKEKAADTIIKLVVARLMDPEEARQVLVKLYPEHEFEEALPDIDESFFADQTGAATNTPPGTTPVAPGQGSPPADE